MFILKSVIIFVILSLAFLSLTFFSPDTPTKKSPSNTETKTIFSKEFFQIEYSLLNQEINYPVSDSISSLQNDFEKDYLVRLA